MVAGFLFVDRWNVRKCSFGLFLPFLCNVFKFDKFLKGIFDFSLFLSIYILGV